MVLPLKRRKSRSPPGPLSLPSPVKQYSPDAGWSSPVARQAHNLKVVGSNPTPATKPPNSDLGRKLIERTRVGHFGVGFAVIRARGAEVVANPPGVPIGVLCKR